MPKDKPPVIGIFEDESGLSGEEENELLEFEEGPVPILSTESLQSDIGQKKIARSLDSYPEADRLEALRRLSYIQWFQRRNKRGWTKKNLQPFMEQAARDLKGPLPSWRTLAGWWSLYIQADCSLEALVPQHKRKGNRQAKVVDDSLYYWRAINEKYLRPERLSIARTYQYYCDLITLANRDVVAGRTKPISKRAFYDRVRKLSPYEVMVARYGKSYANRHFNEVGTHIPATRVLERVEIDHTPLDLILLDDELLIPLGRPYLTALIDVYSKCIVGFYIGYREPSYDSVRKALLNSLLDKTWVRERYPQITKDWPCEGKIEVLVVDNGAEFWSEDLEASCKTVVGDVQYNPVAHPWLKPLIERFFGTVIQRLLASIPGKTFSNVSQLKGYKPEKDAVLRVSTFMEIFHKWIIDEYHYQSDDRETHIPIWTWREGQTAFPPVRYRGEAAHRLVIELGHTRERCLRKTGILFQGIYYSCAELCEYRKQTPPPAGQKQLKVKIKVDPSRLASIYVYLENEERYIEVPSVDSTGYTQDLTLFQHQTNQRVRRLRTRKRLQPVHLAETRMEIDQRIQEDADAVAGQGRRKGKKLKGAKAAARYRNVGSDGASTIVPQLPRATSNNMDQGKETSSGEEDSKVIDDWDDFVSDLDAY